MISNVGNTIQRMINNTPVSASVNATTTSVVTSGGNVFQAGLIANRIQHSFQEIVANTDIQGRIIDSVSTDTQVYFLNSDGFVFQYDYNAGTCSPVVREVYSPAACDSDKAIKIKAGRAHVLILTERHKVFGVGNNEQYQLVPQGQCKYDVATEILVTDTISHDNNCCDKFVGWLNELNEPVIPAPPDTCCEKVSCVKADLIDHKLGSLTISNVTLNHKDDCFVGTLSIPVHGDLSYVGFLCIGTDCVATGSLTYTLNKLAIKSGCSHALFTTCDRTFKINVSNSTELDLLTPPHPPIIGTVLVEGACGSEFHLNVNIIDVILPDICLACPTLVLTLDSTTSIVTALNNSEFTGLTSPPHVNLVVDTSISLNCCPKPCSPCPQQVFVPLPQPCWTNIFAGFDTSVLVDSCNRLYVFGSIHRVRNNRALLQRPCLEELLNNAMATIHLPADQLNCCVRPNNGNCKCIRCCERPCRMDLSKFGVQLSFLGCREREERDRLRGIQSDGCHEKECCDFKPNNVCDFLKALQRCNETPLCNNTCVPCDSFIYLNIAGDCGCPCGSKSAHAINSVTLLNAKSICKTVSQGFADTLTVNVTVKSIVEFDLNRYCVDGIEFPLEKTIILNFGVCGGANVNLFVDINQMGGVQFICNGDKCNVEFTVNASTLTEQFLLNYGEVLDPVVLTNLKFALVHQSIFPCPQFKNPFTTKVFNTYLNGGDRVRFICRERNQRIKHQITPDVPTIFRMTRRVLDVGVGNNNLSVLVGGLACPNEIFAIGQNCSGELGIGSNVSTVCFKQVDRCLFDCQVIAIFTGPTVTTYITQSRRVYGAGHWKCLITSTCPTFIPSICQTWKIKQIAISKNQMILVGLGGNIFGLGDNSLGELGLCHTDCVNKPTPLTFFIRLNQATARQLTDGLSHPVEKHHQRGRFGMRNGFAGRGFGKGFGGHGGHGGFGGHGGHGGQFGHHGHGHRNSHGNHDRFEDSDRHHDGACGNCDIYCEERQFIDPCKKCHNDGGSHHKGRFNPNFRSYPFRD